MPEETMTPRERWLAVLRRQKPDRIPMDYWATPEAHQKLADHLQLPPEQVAERLHIDAPVWAAGVYCGPPPEDGRDIWGIRHRAVGYGTGTYYEACGEPPLARFNSVDQIEAEYAWPQPDHWSYSMLPDQVRGKEHLPIKGGGSEPMLLYKQLRGEEQAFIDLIENPDIVHYCLGRLFDLAYENTRRIFEAIPGVVMITYIAEDMGGQTCLMYSPRQIREFLLPGMKRMIGLVKEHGSYVFHHSDGAVREILPEMIELGIEILNPIQWRCQGMGREGLKRDFGESIIFHGGVDNQQTLPFGSVEDVRAEVKQNIEILGAGGGYIIAPCHNIQAVGPAENVVAMYEAGYEYGWVS